MVAKDTGVFSLAECHRVRSPTLFPASRPCPVAHLTTQLTEGPEPLRGPEEDARRHPALGARLTRPSPTPTWWLRARSEI